jgi:hypothetical protein
VQQLENDHERDQKRDPKPRLWDWLGASDAPALLQDRQALVELAESLVQLRQAILEQYLESVCGLARGE